MVTILLMPAKRLLINDALTSITINNGKPKEEINIVTIKYRLSFASIIKNGSSQELKPSKISSTKRP